MNMIVRDDWRPDQRARPQLTITVKDKVFFSGRVLLMEYSVRTTGDDLACARARFKEIG